MPNRRRKIPENHKWSIGSPPPIIRAHSLAKHRVMRAYLEQYVEVLTSNPRQDQLRLTLIDGFAGGGKYLHCRTKEECAGSPIIMLEAMKRAAVKAQEARQKAFNLDVEYFFVEQEADAFQYLQSTIQGSEFGPMLQSRIHLRNADFVSLVPKIVEHIKLRGRSHRAIFILDQFGYSDVPFFEIRQILAQLTNAEVILTFAVDSLIDYLSEQDLTQELLAKVGIVLPSTDIEAAKRHQEWRRIIQLALHREIPIKTGAKYYTPFFIRSHDAHRDFWLVHLSGHHRAREVMVDLHWKESTSFAHYGGSGLNMLGYDSQLDANWTKQNFLPGYFFDEAAKASSHEALLQQLPPALHSFKSGIPFLDLVSGVSNGTPATVEIIKSALEGLANDGLVEVLDGQGSLKRVQRVTNVTDLVRPHPQKLMSFGS